MTGNPPPGSSYPYGAPAGQQPPPYGGGQQPPPYGGQQTPPYGGQQPPPYGGQQTPGVYGTQSAYGSAPPTSAPYGQPGAKPSKEQHQPPTSKEQHQTPPYGGQQPPPYGGQQTLPHGGEQPYPGVYGTQSAYGSAPPTSTPYGQPGAKPSKEQQQPPTSNPYGTPQPAPSGSGYPYPGGQQGYANPFAMLTPSAFPPGTDPSVVMCFQSADRDNSGFIDDKELQSALSGYNQSFSIRTVHLLMYLFTGTNVRKIGPKEFTSVFYSLQNWRGMFDRFDRDRSGKIDTQELREALQSLGYSVSPMVLDLLVLKFDKSGGKQKVIEYDNFIECCLTVKGLTDKFREKDSSYTGNATFNYEAFMLTILPFLIA